MPPFYGEDRVLLDSDRSAVSAWPSRNGFERIKFKFRSGPTDHNHIAPPSDRPSDNYQTNDGYILRDDNCFRSKWAQRAGACLRQKTRAAATRWAVYIWGERTKQILLLSDGQTGMTAVCEKECVRREKHPVKQPLPVRSLFHHTRA